VARVTREAEIERVLGAASRLAARVGVAEASESRTVPVLYNQDGRPVTLDAADAAALTQALILHARAHSHQRRHAACLRALRKLDRATSSPAGAAVPTTPAAAAAAAAAMALGLLLQADAAFDRVSAGVVAGVDNVAMMHLDIVWLYLLRGEADRFPEAAAYLARARTGLVRAHGTHLERLHALAGEGAAEKLAYVRLRLLEGVVEALEGMLDKARLTLSLARAECDALRVPAATVAMFCSLNPVAEETDAWEALRATTKPAWRNLGALDDMELAEWFAAAADRLATVAQRAERAAAAELAAAVAAARARRWGRTADGAAVAADGVDALVGMGFREAAVVAALRQTNNSVPAALTVLTDNSAALEAAMAAAPLRKRRRHRASDNPLLNFTLPPSTFTDAATTAAAAAAVPDSAAPAAAPAPAPADAPAGAEDVDAANDAAIAAAAAELAEAADDEAAGGAGGAGGGGGSGGGSGDDDDDDMEDVAGTVAHAAAAAQRAAIDDLELESQLIDEWLTRLGAL